MRILIGYDGSESADAALYDLRRAGLPREVEALIISQRVLIEEAQKWDADSIFVGGRKFSGAIERFWLGSVSTALVTNAHCSVEVVRSATS